MSTQDSNLASGLHSKIQSSNTRVAVIGFGYIGTCIGAVLADQGYDVLGIDVRKRVVDEINDGKTSLNEPGLSELIKNVVSAQKLKASSDFSLIKNYDVLVVTVGTPLGADFDPDTRDIVAASEAIAEHLKDGQLIILKSTVPPFTTRKVVEPILKKTGKKFWLSFCPERLAEGRAIQEFKTIPVVVGGVDEESAELSSAFWKKALGIQTIVVDKCESAELVKLADNLWIDLNIALANEIAMLSDKIDVDALQVIAAANSLPKGAGYVNILFPSLGVGGYCLTKDPWFVHHFGKTYNLDLKTPVASRTTNDQMPIYSYQLIETALKESGRSISASKVTVLGVSFKNNTGDCRYTPTIPIIKKLEESGCQLEICDPWVNDEDAREVTSLKLNRNMLEAIRGADCLAFFTGHDDFKELSVLKLKELLKPGAVIFDGRNFFSKEKINEARQAGFIYKGVGR